MEKGRETTEVRVAPYREKDDNRQRGEREAEAGTQQDIDRYMLKK